MPHHTSFDGRHVVFFSWRDTRNPEGGGAEVYLEKVARGLVDRDARVTIFCAEHEDAPRDETRDGIRFVRRGSKMGVYLRGMLRARHPPLRPGRRRRRRPERAAVLHPAADPQAGGGAGAPRAPRAVAGGLSRDHRSGGLVDRVAGSRRGSTGTASTSRCPRRPARSSAASGVDPDRIAVVHNGTDPVLPMADVKSEDPSVCVVGRLVPHKQVEHAIDAFARLRERAARAAPDHRRLGLVGGRAAHATPPASPVAARSRSPAT